MRLVHGVYLLEEEASSLLLDLDRYPPMSTTLSPHFIELADVYLNLDQVAFVRKEDHAQTGAVVAIHFVTAGRDPLYIGEHHFEELRSLLPLREAAPRS